MTSSLFSVTRTLTTPIRSSGICLVCFSTMAQQDLYGVTKDGKFYKGSPPQDASDSWLNRADYIEYGDWKDFWHLFFHPDGTLYGVLNGKFYKTYPPTHATDNWLARATLVDSGGCFPVSVLWPGGNAVWCYKWFSLQAASPTNRQDSWLASAKRIGTSGWSHLKFLFFDPHGILFGVFFSGDLYWGPPAGA